MMQMPVPDPNPLTESEANEGRKGQNTEASTGAKHRGQRYQSCLPDLASSTNLLGGPAIGATSPTTF